MDQTKSIKITDEKVALAKAEHFCAYQERAQQEVRDKLYEWGLWPDAVERIISQLIEGNFLNEERFARIYAKSKFNQKVWGRIKIKQGLKLKRVPDILIKKALLTIDPDDYLTALTHLLQKRSYPKREEPTEAPVQAAAVRHGPRI
ncbi:regulatory protein RecX [Mucilaginibacter sp. P25]|uniref:regulatory protein RecX n=1 Tax=unclassified Mucilaginibacter TaxID=2617802 RepID=UPI003D668E0A